MCVRNVTEMSVCVQPITLYRVVSLVPSVCHAKRDMNGVFAKSVVTPSHRSLRQITLYLVEMCQLLVRNEY